jgi:hypothetical protein
MEVSRMAHIEGRGYVLGINTEGGRRVQVYVSEKGHRVRFYVDGEEIGA